MAILPTFPQVLNSLASSSCIERNIVFCISPWWYTKLGKIHGLELLVSLPVCIVMSMQKDKITHRMGSSPEAKQYSSIHPTEVPCSSNTGSVCWQPTGKVFRLSYGWSRARTLLGTATDENCASNSVNRLTTWTTTSSCQTLPSPCAVH